MVALGVVALVGAALLARGPSTARSLALLALLPAWLAARADVRTGRLPDGWVAATALMATVAWAWSPSHAATALAASLAVAVPLVAHLVSPMAVGFGDVKFVAALAPAVATAGLGAGPAVAAGARAGLTSAVWLTLAFGAAVVGASMSRRPAAPVGPALAASALLVLSVPIITSLA